MRIRGGHAQCQASSARPRRSCCHLHRAKGSAGRGRGPEEEGRSAIAMPIGDVGFEAEHERARLPVVADLTATDEAIRMQRRPDGGKRLRVVDARLAPGISDVQTAVEAGPVVCSRHDGCRPWCLNGHVRRHARCGHYRQQTNSEHWIHPNEPEETAPRDHVPGGVKGQGGVRAQSANEKRPRPAGVFVTCASEISIRTGSSRPGGRRSTGSRSARR